MGGGSFEELGGLKENEEKDKKFVCGEGHIQRREIEGTKRKIRRAKW